MTSDLRESRVITPEAAPMPEPDEFRLREAESLILQALERLHVHALTAPQREAMAQALSDQIAATSRLRRFPLGNDDAPCFIPARAHHDG